MPTTLHSIRQETNIEGYNSEFEYIIQSLKIRASFNIPRFYQVKLENYGIMLCLIRIVPVNYILATSYSPVWLIVFVILEVIQVIEVGAYRRLKKTTTTTFSGSVTIILDTT